MSESNKAFADRLRSLRKKRGLLQKELADALGYSEKAVSKWERGESAPPLSVINALADLLNCDPNELLDFQSRPAYFLGIDGGGTKTAFALADAQGTILRECTLSAGNPIDIGMERTRAILEEGIRRVSGDYPLRKISLYAGLAGGTTGNNAEELARFFSGFGFAACKNGSDLDNALAAALHSGDGIVSILGTGNITIAVKDGKRIRYGGYGYFFDEGGSGFDIGRAGIAAALADRDGRGEHTRLTSLLEEKAGCDIRSYVGELYSGGKKLIASFAPLVTEAAAENDPVSLSILEKSIHWYASLLRVAAKNYGAAPVRAVMVGGLSRVPLIRSLLLRETGDLTNLTLEFSEQPPVLGALLLAKNI